MYTQYDYNNELYHYGVKGMKWGVRRYQRPDGSLTKRGRKWAASKEQPSSFKSSYLAGIWAATGNERIERALDKSNDRDAELWKLTKNANSSNQSRTEAQRKAARRKKIAIGAAVVGGTILAGYGAYKINQIKKPKPLTTNELRKMGIETFDYDTFNPESFDYSKGVFNTSYYDSMTKKHEEAQEKLKAATDAFESNPLEWLKK